MVSQHRRKRDPSLNPSASRQPLPSKQATSDVQDHALGTSNQHKTKKVKHRVKTLLQAEMLLEDETALAVGFPYQGLADNELALLDKPDDANNYIRVRNHILTKWRGDVSRWLTQEDAQVKIQNKFRKLVVLAWNYLTRNGYINYGVAPEIRRLALPVNDSFIPRSVVVIGAGLAGMAAARQLRMMGHKVVVLEGKDRPGGRVHGKKLEGQGQVAVADLGGSIITGIDGNPLAVLAKQLQVPLYNINTSFVPLFTNRGQRVDTSVDTAVEAQFNDILDKSSQWARELGEAGEHVSLETALETMWQQEMAKKGSGEVGGEGEREGKGEQHSSLDRQLFDWHLANLEFANACQLGDLSMRHWDLDDEYEFSGAHVFMPGSNLRIVRALAQDLSILYNTVVRTIRYSGNEVQVCTDTHTFHADAVLVTVSLGVLKSQLITFDPPLPAYKTAAIQHLGFGVLNKVVLLFPTVWWDKEHIDMWGRVGDDKEGRGEGFLFYSYSHISGGPLIIALVAGKAAIELEVLPPGECVQRVMAVIRRTFQPIGIDVPPPIAAAATRWGQDPLTCGSYSYAAVGSKGPADYEAIAEHVGGRLFFAGEATVKRYPATMHGAYLSGVREAANIDACFAGLKGGAKGKDKDKGRDKRSGEGRSEVDVGGGVASLVAEEQLEELGKLERRLEQLFEDDSFGVDYVIGPFKIVLGPVVGGSAVDGKERKQMGVLQIEVPRGKGGAGEVSTQRVYHLLGIEQIEALVDCPGGCDARWTLLTEAMGLNVSERMQPDLRLFNFVSQVQATRQRQGKQTAVQE